MKIPVKMLMRGTVWTAAVFGLITGLRFATNLILSRLLAPELFGIMTIINTLRTGIELISDVGIGQNIIYSEHAEEPDYYNTAWTIQAIRSIILWIAFCALAAPIASFYNMPALLYLIPVTGGSILLNGFTSVSRELMRKRMWFAKLNLFELAVTLASSAIMITWAYLTPTIWSLVLSGVASSGVVMVASYFLPLKLTYRISLSKSYTAEILHFGKWIFISSIIYFFAVNFDRLYLAKVIPIQILGVYGLARSMAELSGALVGRLGGYVLFPFISAHVNLPRELLRKQLLGLRGRFLLLVALSLGLLASCSDLIVTFLYDTRYHAAAWMLPILVIGSWPSLVANINESALLGLGKPSYGAVANALKLAFLLVGLPLGIAYYGVVGAVTVVALVDLPRYFPILIGQWRARFSFGAQDLLMTAVMFSMIAVLQWVRWRYGFGTVFDLLPENVLR